MRRDARDYQILFLSLFLALGIWARDWTLHPEMIGVAIATCSLTQLIGTWAAGYWPELFGRGQPTNHTPPPFNWRSPLITALALSLLLRTDHYTTMTVASFLAIASKFVFHINDKHCFNPANFGIVATLLLSQDAWVSPGQWGEDLWYAFIFFGAGGLVLKRVGRWDTTVAFLGSYACLEALRNLWLGWTWDVWAHRLMSGSLLLFALFMITDPRSIPNSRPGRLIWAVAIALLSFILRNQFFFTTAVFWALFALAPLTILLDRCLPATRFRWQDSAPLTLPKSSEAISG